MSRILNLCVALATLQTGGTGMPPAVAPASAPKTPDELARTLFEALLARDLDRLCQLTPPPFSFDGADARSREEVRRAWTRVLQRHKLAGRELQGIEILSYEELVKRNGEPPERLSGLPLAGSEAALVNLGGRPTILLMRKRGTTYVPFAVTD
jgi:hypothetical protein